MKVPPPFLLRRVASWVQHVSVSAFEKRLQLPHALVLFYTR